ncbi:OPSD protein, partial [Atractosteus spatula]|nr:OPSD protein [Atractosteus spatula]
RARRAIVREATKRHTATLKELQSSIAEMGETGGVSRRKPLLKKLVSHLGTGKLIKTEGKTDAAKYRQIRLMSWCGRQSSDLNPFEHLWAVHKWSPSNLMEIELFCSLCFQMAVLISTGFIVCWTPYVVVSFLTMFQSKDSLTPVASLLPCLFAKSSTAYNPFIYYVFSRSFRRELRKMKCCCGFRVHLSKADISASSHFTVGGNLRDDDAKSASAKKQHQ